jgi:DNA end-binding protein Ku
MTTRAVWKGFLKFGAVSCAVKLIGATSEAEKVRFRILDRKTRQPVKAAYLDEETGDVVEGGDQVKGLELKDGDHLHIEPEELKKLKLTSEHTLEVDATIPIDTLDRRYLEKPYYLVPADGMAAEPFLVILKALERSNSAARSCIVLHQRGREVIIEPKAPGMLMTTLRDNQEVLSEKQVFAGISRIDTDPEMLEIADLLIEKKSGAFDPASFVDRYEDALIAMLEAKKAGRKPPRPATPPKRTNVVDLASVLRKSLAKEGISEAPSKRTCRSAARKKKAA